MGRPAIKSINQLKPASSLWQARTIKCVMKIIEEKGDLDVLYPEERQSVEYWQNLLSKKPSSDCSAQQLGIMQGIMYTCCP